MKGAILGLLLLAAPLSGQLNLVIVNAANGNQSTFAPGSLAVAVAYRHAPASSTNPVDLSNASLVISPGDGSPSIPAQILGHFDSGSLLVLLPRNLPIGAAIASVNLNGEISSSVSLSIATSSFGLFTGPISLRFLYFTDRTQGNAAIYVSATPAPLFAQKNSSSTIGLANPAHPGDYITFWGTGLGNATQDQVTVTLAGLPIPVTYAGSAPGQIGVDQINVLVPPEITAPDACSDAFAITIMGASVAPVSFPFTQTAAVCPNSFGFTTAELAQIDAASIVNFGYLQLYSAIRPATVADNAGTGFTRDEHGDLGQTQWSSLFEEQIVTDTLYYSCQAVPAFSIKFAALSQAIPGVFLTMGSASLTFPDFSASSPLPNAVSTPDQLPPPFFQPGTWQLTAPNFSRSVTLPPPIQLQNFAALQSIDTTHDLSVSWNPAGYSNTDVVTLRIGAGSEYWFAPTGIDLTCRARATAGAIIVPSAQLRLTLLDTLPTLTATVAPRPDGTQNFRLPTSGNSTLPLQINYSFSETFPVTLH